MTPQAFIQLLKPHAQKVQAKLGISWQALIAQAALETGWLAHPTVDKHSGRDSYNLFNIKADKGWQGDTVVIDTTEYTNGKRVKVEARFRAYKDYAESFEDYCQFILRNPRYKLALAAKADPIRYVQELQKAGYATDPQYATKIVSIMNKYIA